MKKIFLLLVATTLILCGCLHEENQSHSSLSNSSDFNTENTVSGDIDVSSQIIDNSSEPENNPKEITESFMKKCNRSLGGYALFNGTHWFYNSFDDVNGLYKCDADGKNVVCIENFESAQRLMLESTEDAVFYVKTSLLETPIEIGEYEIPFYKELCSYSDDNVKVISSENILDYEISGENIYYTSCDLKIYRIKLDGTQKEVIGEIPYPMDLQIVNEKIFTHSNEAVYEMDLNGNVTNIYNLLHYSSAC